MRCFFFESIFADCIKSGQGQHQCLFTLAGCLSDHCLFYTSALLFIFVQDGLDPDNGIQNVRTCISFKRSKPLNIKHVIFGSLVGKIAVFYSCQTYQLGSRLCFFWINGMVFHDLPVHFLLNVFQKVLQTHHAALSGLKRLSVFSIHGAKSKEGQLSILFYQFCFFCTAEHLDEMHFLALVYYIQDLIGMIIFHTLYNGSQVCGSVQGRTV